MFFAMGASENECVIRGVHVFVISTIVAPIRKTVSADEGSLGCAIVHLIFALTNFEDFLVFWIVDSYLISN